MSDSAQSMLSACECGDTTTVRRLVHGGADVDAPVDLLGRTPLYVASESGHLRLVRALLERGASVDKTCLGWTPLHAAAKNGRGTVVRLLIDYGADVEAVVPDGRSPSTIAEQHGHASTAALVRGEPPAPAPAPPPAPAPAPAPTIVSFPPGSMHTVPVPETLADYATSALPLASLPVFYTAPVSFDELRYLSGWGGHTQEMRGAPLVAALQAQAEAEASRPRSTVIAVWGTAGVGDEGDDIPLPPPQGLFGGDQPFGGR
jgi:hypothetical protein